MAQCVSQESRERFQAMLGLCLVGLSSDNNSTRKQREMSGHVGPGLGRAVL
ncbi:hypothetical protein DPMN_021602 [Dreissena polymorpha]|uniref:Uncharacterized protein n=1 Tax=Dreissena polymorpha TaxID=45954 RepID=A0A9D4NP09_DREPO|nr:hypothetical protein DPMN_021602 [Dreissena polymorpha]